VNAEGFYLLFYLIVLRNISLLHLNLQQLKQNALLMPGVSKAEQIIMLKMFALVYISVKVFLVLKMYFCYVQ